MRLIALATTAAIVLMPGASALAQQIGERLPGQKSDYSASNMPSGRASKAMQGASPCPEYGPGFVRMAGSNTCMRAGGKVMYEYGMTGNRRSDLAPTTGSRSAFTAEFESRTDTEAGPFRTVVRGVVTRDTGNRIGTIPR